MLLKALSFATASSLCCDEILFINISMKIIFPSLAYNQMVSKLKPFKIAFILSLILQSMHYCISFLWRLLIYACRFGTKSSHLFCRINHFIIKQRVVEQRLLQIFCWNRNIKDLIFDSVDHRGTLSMAHRLQDWASSLQLCELFLGQIRRL